jgi:Zn-dependent peptidase ImmA (M78 family)
VSSKSPTTFSIGHLKYKITFATPDHEALETSEGRGLDGLASQAQGIIVVNCNEKYTEEYQKLVLLHEIIHTICTAHGTDLGENTEDVIDSLAFGIIQAVNQNKWMKEYFF